MSTIAQLRRILKDNHTIAIVGLSADWYRPSYFAAKYMQEHGFRIIPVNPKYTEILGEKCYPDLKSIPEKVDMVDVFRKSADCAPIENDEAKAIADSGGLEFVQNRCVKIEYARLFGGLSWFGVNTRIISSRRPV
jgi:predicted CoA-binding protein